MKKCAIYARVSTPDQRVDNQLFDLRLFAQQRGFEVVAEFTDVGISGSKARRPGLDAMLRDARKRKFAVVIVAAFDRLARSTKHFLTVVDELDSLGVEFISRRENIATDGAMGRLFLTLISSIAELEADLIKERVRAGIRRRKLEGLPVGRQPLDVDHEAIVAARLNGGSLTEVARRYSVSRASVVRWVSLAKALCVRKQRERNKDAGDWKQVDAAVLAVEKEAGRLTQMKTWTETIQSSSGKILDEVRKMADNLEKQVAVLRESVETLRQE